MAAARPVVPMFGSDASLSVACRVEMYGDAGHVTVWSQ